MLTVFLYLVIFPYFTLSQFLSYDAIRMRVPGRCMQGDYDCGLGQCVSISQFRDGKPDCMDGSDEWCFIGQVSCGPVYCADYKDALPCIVYPNCDGSSKQLPWCKVSKEKLCAEKRSFPCKGYGECVLWEWLLDGKKDCIDGSDEDENYVMPLEHAYRCARNQTGLYLPKPIPPPPEDHPSLYVEGCSFCPNSGKSVSGSLPTDASVDHTTPKYPFITSSPLIGSKEISTPDNPTEDSKHGDFFPSGVEISRVTHPQTPESNLPNEPIGEFFPTHSSIGNPTESPTKSHTFRGITIPSNGRTQFPQAPLIFPMRPDLAPITAPSPLNNWPIPIVTTTPDSHHQGSLPPITYPTNQHGSEKIPPIRPGIIIRPPITSAAPPGIESGGYSPEVDPYGSHKVASAPSPETFTTAPPLAAFRPITRPIEGNYGSFENGSPEEPKFGGQKPGVDVLIPLLPGNVLPNFPTRRPITVPSFFTPMSHTTSAPLSYVTEMPKVVNQGVLPTLIPDTELGKYLQTKVPPSPSITELPDVHFATRGNKQTKTPGGFIEETTPLPDTHGTQQTELLTKNPLPETTTFPHTKTTSRSKTIHVGPNGIIANGGGDGDEKTTTEDNIEHTKQPEDPEDHVVTGTDNIIHIGPTQPTSQSSTSSTTVSNTVTESSSTLVTTPVTSVGDPETDNCIRKMLGENPDHSFLCKCPNGQFMNFANGNCEEALSLLNMKVNVNSICNSDRLTFEEKQKILHKKIGTFYPSCIHPSSYGSAIVATVQCDKCTLSDVNRVITTRSFGEPGSLNVTSESFGSALCEDSNYNHCHVYSDCVVDTEGLRYSCRCKEGTTDASGGYGRQCEGFPAESDCIMVFGICLIVWLIFLLGAFMLSLLSCIACYTLCRQRCCRQVAIHPMNADGLQTVIIGPKAAKSLDPNGNKERMPHMKAIFAESLKHSAKGSTSVASAFALADFRRKKVSRPPEMSQVIEEVNENIPTPLPPSESLPKVSSLAKISTHTANSEPPTPVGVIETPILEKNSSSVSLVSANDNAPQLPSLPLPLPVPITTSASTTNLEEKAEKDKDREAGTFSPEQQVAETERPASSHSIGVQPTIWETYRVLGQQYSKTDLTERKASVDSLEQMFEARLAETARTTRTIPTVRTDKSDSSAIMFTAKPHKDETEKSAATMETMENPESTEKTVEDIAEEIQKNTEDAKENHLKETDTKLADMIGITSFHASRAASPSKPGSTEKTPNEATTQEEMESFSPSLEKSLEAALLIEMAKRGIELPLSPVTPVPTSDELDKVVAQKKSVVETEDSDVIPVKPKPETPKKVPESRKTSAKSSASSRKSRIPSVSQSRVSSAKQRISRSDQQDNEPEVFVPQGARAIHEKKKTLRRSGATSELVPLTDESDPEIAFFKRLEKMKKETDSHHTPFQPGRKYSRRRKPERTLSSISEKSAEIAAEAALEYPVDTSVSCPPTTRSFLEPRAPPVRRYVVKRKVIEAADETSDVDIPKLKPAKTSHPLVSSPEIPDVTFQRSMENLHKSDLDAKPDPLVSSRLSSGKKSNFIQKKPRKNGVEPSSSVQSSHHGSKVGSKATTPRNGEDTPLSHTSRSTRHSVISRKIAIRRHELKAVSGSAHDLSRTSPSRTTAAHAMRGAKSVGDLSKRRPPHWDISPYRDTPGPSSFLPPITPSRGIRTTANSPQPRNRRSDSHFSMTSLPLISHSPTSFWSSPHFNPSEDSRKPPKEDLWWNPNKRS